MAKASIIIATWNNADRIDGTLRSICAMRVPDDLNWDVVVVNNNCTDHTDDVVGRYQELLPLRLVREQRQGLSHARNAGLAVASGELIIFGDDDIRVSPAWLMAYMFAFRENPAGYFFGGPVLSDYEAGPPSEEIRDFAAASVVGVDLGAKERVLDRPAFIGPNWACRRVDLDHYGGFDPELGLNPEKGQVLVGEEKELMRRMMEDGIRPLYLPRASVEHFVPAEKCRLRHIADRLEAGAYYLKCRELRRVGETPPRMSYRWWARYFRQWLRYGLRSAALGNGKREYLRLCQMRGARRACAEMATSPKKRRYPSGN